MAARQRVESMVRTAFRAPRQTRAEGGVVALARKLLVALWKYLDWGEIPAGARLVSWRAKVNAKATTAA